MGLRDRFTDAVGGVLGGGLEIITESLAKANTTPPNSKLQDEPTERGAPDTRAQTSVDATRRPLPPEPTDEDPKALLFDPFALIDQLGYRDRPSGLTYSTLRQMAVRVPTYTGILQTRVNQVSSFAQRQKDKFAPGCGLILRDDKASPTRQDKIRMRQLEDMILQTGVEWHPGRDDFRTFLRKLTRDSLTLDQACFEIQRNRKGDPCAFYAVDGATIRLADVPPGADTRFDPNQVKYVQVYDEVIISEFGAADLCFGVRNPRSDIRANSYGFSELEMLINVITSLLWSFEYNKKQFCATPDTKVWTDLGLVPLSDLAETSFKVWTGRDWQSARAFPTQTRPVMRTLLWNGVELKTSPEHRFRVLKRESSSVEPVWAAQEELKPGDYLLQAYGEADAPLDEDQFFVGREYPVTRRTQNPWIVTSAVVNDPEFWEMIGFALGDGYFPPRQVRNPNWLRICPHNENDTEVWELIRRVCDRHKINLKDGVARAYSPRVIDQDVLNIYHTNFVRWLYDIGFRPSSEGKIIPDVLFRSPVFIRSAVLKGLFSADGHSRHHESGYVTPTLRVTDRSFRQTVLKCLWSVGVAAQDMGSGWDRIGNIEVQDIPRFVKRIGYHQAYKNEGLFRSDRAVSRWDGVHPKVCVTLAQTIKAHPYWLDLTQNERALVGLAAAGKCKISRPRLLAMFETIGEAIPEALEFLQVPIDVLDTEPGEVVQMFDVEVFDNRHLFLADGVAVHNSQGSLVHGVMNFKGNSMSRQKIDAFRREWKMMASGVSNAHRVPMTNAEELQWIDFGKNNRDMEYSAWFDFLIKVTCATMQFDPAEIGFSYGNSGQTSQMFASPVEGKLQESKDKGLKPLLSDIATWLNTHIIWSLDPTFEFAFLGLDAKSSDQAIEQGKKRSSFSSTVDELRAEDDKDPLPDGKGAVILDPVWLQNAQAIDAAAMQDEQGLEDGGEGDMGDVTGLGSDDTADPDNADFDYESLFPEKSVKPTDDQLKKSGRRVKVRVYEIEI